MPGNMTGIAKHAAAAPGIMQVLTGLRADVAQAVNSLDGELIDSVTLTKPPGWQPDQTGQLQAIALFHSTYTPTWLELSGINGPAEDLILRPAEALLFSDPELLDQLRNATLVQVRSKNPCMSPQRNRNTRLPYFLSSAIMPCSSLSFCAYGVACAARCGLGC
jgi:hypothetical protein